MQLSRTIAVMAVVLGVVTGAAIGQDSGQKKVDDREAQRRAAIEGHEKRKVHFERACDKALKSETDFALCRAAYRALTAPEK